MKYLKQLQKKKIFDTAFVEGLTGNIMTGKSLLQSYKKAGFLLEHFSENLNLSPSFLNTCKSKINKRKRNLIAGEKMIYYPEWKLYAPQDLFSEWGDELV